MINLKMSAVVISALVIVVVLMSVFIVDERGRVVEPRVRNSTDPIFEKSALTAVKRWRFEPGKRNGKPVRFRMLVPITFPKG